MCSCIIVVLCLDSYGGRTAWKHNFCQVSRHCRCVWNIDQRDLVPLADYAWTKICYCVLKRTDILRDNLIVEICSHVGQSFRWQHYWSIITWILLIAGIYNSYCEVRPFVCQSWSSELVSSWIQSHHSQGVDVINSNRREVKRRTGYRNYSTCNANWYCWFDC